MLINEDRAKAGGWGVKGGPEPRCCLHHFVLVGSLHWQCLVYNNSEHFDLCQPENQREKKSDTEELIFFFLFCHGQRKFENIYKIFHKRKKTLRRRKKNVELPDLEEGTCAVCSNGKCRKKKTSAQKQTLCDRLCWRSSCSALFIRPLCLGNNDTDAAHTGTERGKKKVIIRLHMENRGKIKKIGNMGRNKTIVTGRRTMSTTE